MSTYTQCADCGGWRHRPGDNHRCASTAKRGLAPSARSSVGPLWCVCEQPTVATAYGWTYCGNCQRGLQPEAVSPDQTQQQQHEDRP